MAVLTKQDVGDLMRQFNEELQPAGACVATPAKMRELLTQLEEYTAEVQWARNKYKALGFAGALAGLPGMVVSDFLGGGDVSVAQWRQDMTTWQYRLAEYQRILDTVPEDLADTAEGCAAIYTGVTAPLLDGIWYEPLPGITLSTADEQRLDSGEGHPQEDITGEHPPGHTTPKPPDVITPFTLGNQIVTYQEFQKERAQRFIDDLKRGAKEVIKAGDPDTWPWYVWAGIIAGGSVVTGLGAMYLYQWIPKPRRRNPARKRKRKNVTDTKVRKMLAEAEPYRQYGPRYNRSIDESARWLEETVAKGTSRDTPTKELRLRLDYWTPQIEKAS